MFKFMLLTFQSDLQHGSQKIICLLYRLHDHYYQFNPVKNMA